VQKVAAVRQENSKEDRELLEFYTALWKNEPGVDVRIVEGFDNICNVAQ
jgi:hypothetical protein